MKERTPERLAARSWSWQLFGLSATAAVAVSTIYLPQSLLANLASSLGVAPGVASITATAVQVGYAIGIFLLVPLSDRIQPRRQITLQLFLLAAALLLAAAMPEIVSVALGFLVVGLVANIAQLIIPAANKLAPEGRSGTTTTALVGALLVGIFGGRIVASLLVAPLGWRLVVLVFAALVLVLLPIVRRSLRQDVRLNGIGTSYGSLLTATLRLARTSRPLVLSSAMHFFAFGAFNALWAVMVLHLTSPEYGWSVAQAGLFGLIGLVAGLATPLSGRYIDRFGQTRVAGVFLGLAVLMAVTTIVDNGQIVLFSLSMFVLTWANQSAQSSNQNRVMQANPEAQAQANTFFMVSVFLGGSVGALVGPAAFVAGGMTLAGVAASVLMACAFGVWLGGAASTRRAAVAAA